MPLFYQHFFPIVHHRTSISGGFAQKAAHQTKRPQMSLPWPHFWHYFIHIPFVWYGIWPSHQLFVLVQTFQIHCCVGLFFLHAVCMQVDTHAFVCACKQTIHMHVKKNAVFCSFAANVFRRERNCFKPAAKNPRIRNVDATIITLAVPTRVFGPLSSKESKHKQFVWKLLGCGLKQHVKKKCLYICLMKKYFYCKFQSKL